MYSGYRVLSGPDVHRNLSILKLPHFTFSYFPILTQGLFDSGPPSDWHLGSLFKMKKKGEGDALSPWNF